MSLVRWLLSPSSAQQQSNFSIAKVVDSYDCTKIIIDSERWMNLSKGRANKQVITAEL